MSLGNGWEYVIGLEVHAQVKSNSKLFSSSPATFGQTPNSCVALFDAALPGMLPVLNEHCVRQAIKTGLAINATINKVSAFDRKNYFYPDLPSGYQISQFYHPIVSNGYLDIEIGDQVKRIRIERIHLEKDAGKSLHDQDPTKTFIDLNRAGIGLMEIVTAPDLSSPEEAAEYLKKLRSILRYLGTCDGDMEKGSMRCDANVSVRKKGAPLGTRCEIKNLNSIKNIVSALEYEAERQIEIIEAGGVIEQETRLFDAEVGETRLMRSKEDALDYRYFPDPDLPPLVLEQDYIDQVKKEMIELPDAKKQRYIDSYGLSKYDAGVLSADKAVADYFEIVAKNSDYKLAANWIMGELFSYLNDNDLEIVNAPIKPEHLAELINLISDKTISGKIAKDIFKDMTTSNMTPKEIVKAKNLGQISDPNQLAEIIDEVVKNNPETVQEYLSGKTRLFGFLVGQVIKASGNKADPVLVNKLLQEKLQKL
ncbi:Asp-tRNA(Asn)/Glu-tRNA(Gln) amidotransferase subunit GatB [Candidatus Phycorickettsia trachydisci]|nr:Asp-tRNA(Asn)/Glu-tRNA(Gln) amidotransferase subunit GatB [Candidatus Phycorickettsia trachydisci]